MTHEKLTAQLVQTQQALEQANSIIQWMESSKFWKLRLAWLKMRRKLKSPFDRSTASLSQLVQTLLAPTHPNGYAHWQQKHTPRPADLQKLTEIIEILPHKPLISVVMPVFNPPESFLRDAIESVINQIYPNWELCIADDASTEPYVREVLTHYQVQDDRIRVKFRETNGHISHCSNSALELATGEFVALLDHDDLLTPDALYEVALLINRHPTADMIYSDEDKIDEQGQLTGPFFKPEWCPDSFLSKMYTCHLGTYRRSLVNEIGGFRAGLEGSQDYDLVLRVTEKTHEIFHIPKILYHWRIHEQSVTSGAAAKPYAFIAAEKAIAEALDRRGEPGQVTGIPGYLGHYSVRYKLLAHPRVSIIIPTRDLSHILDRCLESIFSQTTYSNYDVLVIDNGSVEPSAFEVFDRWQIKEPQRFRCQRLDIPFNYSILNNYAVEHCQGDYLLFLNNDTEVLTPDWIDAMLEQAQRPSIGAVGARLLYPDGTLQHGGVIAGLGGLAAHSHRHYPGDAPGYYCQILTINNYSAVTAACMMCRRDVFLKVGGFEEALAGNYNDVDFCFKLLEKGYRNVYLPHVKLYHHESKSRGMEDTLEKKSRFQQEFAHIRRKWTALIDNDPCYSPHLTRDREDYSINV